MSNIRGVDRKLAKPRDERQRGRGSIFVVVPQVGAQALWCDALAEGDEQRGRGEREEGKSGGVERKREAACCSHRHCTRH
eukprot:2790563-Prymnesium_polylepis.2